MVSWELALTSTQGLFDQLPDKLDQGRSKSGTTKKRSASAAKSGSTSSTQGGQASSAVAQRTDDLIRSRGVGLPNGAFAPPSSHVSMDALHAPTEQSFPDPTFGSMPDFMTMDMSRATPDSTSTRASSHQPGFPSQALSSQNTVNKLDTLMFPTGDPFAYPNQPMMELSYHPKSDISPATLMSQGPDPQFFMPGSMEEMDTQLLGQPPPYVMQAPNPHVQPVMGMPGNMYDPSSFMGMHTGSQKHPQHPPPPPPQAQPQQPQLPQQRSSNPQRRQAAQTLANQRRAQVQRMREQQIEQMFTEQGMQPDWGGFFGSGRGGFQGM